MTVRPDQHHRVPEPPATQPPLVSVVIPVYNASDSLAAAVQSISAQQIAEVEILLVDDCSTDDSLEVAKHLAQQDARVQVFRHTCNRGQSAARNLALDKARGSWIALLDADDEFAPDRLRVLCEAGEAGRADLIADGVEFAGPRQPGAPPLLRASSGGALQTLTLRRLIRSDIPLNGMCSFGYLKPLIRRSFLERCELRYDEDLRFAEDLNFFARALMHGARWLMHPQTYYIYHQTNPLSVSRNLGALPRTLEHALLNNHRLREFAATIGVPGLDDLLDEHEDRWATVLWFNRLKLAVRDGRYQDAMHLTLDCPSGPRGMIRFARDRVRMKRAQAAAAPARAPVEPIARENGGLRS